MEIGVQTWGTDAAALRRYWALADAARCRALAGQTQQALALYDRLAAEAPDLQLSDHEAARARELRAAAGLAAPTPAATAAESTAPTAPLVPEPR